MTMTTNIFFKDPGLPSLIEIPHTGPDELQVCLSPRGEFFFIRKPVRYCILLRDCKDHNQKYLHADGTFQDTCGDCWYESLPEVQNALFLYQLKKDETNANQENDL